MSLFIFKTTLALPGVRLMGTAAARRLKLKRQKERLSEAGNEQGNVLLISNSIFLYLL